MTQAVTNITPLFSPQAPVSATAAAPPPGVSSEGRAAPGSQASGSQTSDSKASGSKASGAPTPDSQVAGAPASKSDAPAADATPSPTKLVIEHSKQSLTFVYKIVDRASGDVLAEFPREAAESLATKPTYAAGDVVDETA